MKLRTFGMTVVAALALVAGSAQAQDAGWDTKYGILFTLPNPFGGASGTNIINDYDAKVGAQYNLAPTRGLRLSARIARESHGIEKTTNGTVETETVPNPTSAYLFNVMGQYMIRMTTAAVSPYFGAGAFLNFGQANMTGEDKTDGTVTMKYEDYSRSWGLGANGTMGVEWRVHKSFALFAEYQADLTLISSTHDYTKHTAGTVTTETETTQMQYLNLDMTIAQGGQLGFIAFF